MTVVAGARKSSTRKKTRGAPPVEGVLHATVHDLGRVGYRALRIDDVAARANVHKTTIYRRFPTKLDLVQATIQSVFEDNILMPDTGSLRGDLLSIANGILEFSTSVGGKALARMMMTESAEEDLRKIMETIRNDKEAVPRQ